MADALMEEVKKVLIKNRSRTFFYKGILLLMALAVIVGPVKDVLAQGSAALFFSPNAGSFTKGQRFGVGIFVSSREQAMNAFEMVINFPSDKLEVASLSKSGSVASLWVQEPTYNNSAGTINLVGVVLNPGYTGSSGKLISITFKVKSVGSADVTMTSASILANDGLGTNILGSIGSAKYNLVAGEAPREVISDEIPEAPQISSPTHPDQNKWYSKNEATFTWPLTQDINGVSILVNDKPASNPGSGSDGLLSSHTIKDLNDGIWYFHARMHNSAGWGGIAHYKFQIDTAPPEIFELKEVARLDPTEPKISFTLEAKDKLSGVDHYELRLDDAPTIILTPSEGLKTYETGLLVPGKHILNVKVIDSAGNFRETVLEPFVEGLRPPTITDYPREITSGDPLEVRGTTYPESTVTLFLEKENAPAITKRGQSNSVGGFAFAFQNKLEQGTYKVWAEVVDNRGARSGPSDPVTTIIKPTPFRKFITGLFTVIVPVLNLLILFLILLYYIWRKFRALKKRLRKEIREVETSLHKAFDLLRDDLRVQIRLLEKTKTRRELTREEDRILKKLQKDLNSAERLLKKEIEDIEKEVK